MSNVRQLAESLLKGKIEVIDLSHTLKSEFPTLTLPPQFGQTWAFKKEEISRYDDRGPGWYWNNFSCGEHTGTHFDAPIHWYTGADAPENSVDRIDPKRFMAPAVVVDATHEVSKDPDWILEPEFIIEWEKKHGLIAPGSWFLFRTGWSKKINNPLEFANLIDGSPHTPGPSQRTVEWLISERGVVGFGVETINIDAGQSGNWEVPYPCHNRMLGEGRFGLQCLNNLDKLPPTGSVILSAPLKIEDGSGSPLRVLAIFDKQ
ncbi:cyclase family protein [Pseudomonas sp. phDV1]|uniref:cyclase family protein n=1 Tax=Stutzerimonas stutzeri TaxID=316 RepID=UPI000E3022AA|nr:MULTISPECIES: cyclase family protein [Pseudomonadaceae]AXO63726.1 cyclase family protein [Pseudomonas sp. phDV1]MDH0428112.1 cyclase family protein [Stutzerimonas stutzeri]